MAHLYHNSISHNIPFISLCNCRALKCFLKYMSTVNDVGWVRERKKYYRTLSLSSITHHIHSSCYSNNFSFLLRFLLSIHGAFVHAYVHTEELPTVIKQTAIYSNDRPWHWNNAATIKMCVLKYRMWSGGY